MKECVCSCQGVTAGSLCPLSQRGCDCWSVTSLSPACLPYIPPPPLFLYSLACPATLLVALSLFRFALHMGLVSHGNLLSPIRSSRQLGFPSILPFLLSGPATSPCSSPVASRSSIPQSEPLSRPKSCQADGHTVPGAWMEAVICDTSLLCRCHACTAMLLHPNIPGQTDRRTHALRGSGSTLSPARCCVLSLASPAGLDQMAGGNKMCVLGFISLWLNFSRSSYI